MPYTSEKLKIAGSKFDRRIKLTTFDKEKIVEIYALGQSSINQIARDFHVSKRLIQFVLFPERQTKNIQYRKERGGSKQYYNKNKHRESMKDTRHYKQDLKLRGQI